MAKGNNAIKLARDFNKQFSSLFSDEVKCCEDGVLLKKLSFTNKTSLVITHTKLAQRDVYVIDTTGLEFEPVQTFSNDGKTVTVDFGGATKSGTATYFIKK